jgi:hypothetical protein
LSWNVDDGQVSSSAALGLDALRLLEVTELSLLTWHVLDLLSVGVSNAHDLVGQVVLEVVLVGHDSQQVVVVAVDVGDLSSVSLQMSVVLSDRRSLVIEVLLQVLELSRLVNLQELSLTWWHCWWLIALVVWRWQLWELEFVVLWRVVSPLSKSSWSSSSDHN